MPTGHSEHNGLIGAGANLCVRTAQLTGPHHFRAIHPPGYVQPVCDIAPAKPVTLPRMGMRLRRLITIARGRLETVPRNSYGSAPVRQFGGLDILVNSVGAVKSRAGGFLVVTDEEWMSALTINFLAAVRTTCAALPLLLERGAGAIVTVNSVNWFLPDPSIIDYCAAKGALANFSKALSKEVGGRKVRVNSVSPGPVSTALWLGDQGVAATVGAARGVDPTDIEAQAAAAMVTGRFTRPEEVADLVVMLASDRTANVTGSDFVIDGGLITTL